VTVDAADVRARTLDRALGVFGSDRAANRAFAGFVLAAMVVFAVVGRDQWFIRDDWAIVLTREKMSARGDVVDSYLLAKDGHWMTIPIAVYRVLDALFGLGSYWPYLVVNLAAHTTIVVLVRVICARVGVSAWTATLVCGSLLVLGSGWENIVFAVQITYNFSLLAFLAQLVLVDRDGPIGKREVLAAVAGIVGVASSGFGPFFVAGTFLLLVLRGRVLAAFVVSAPATAAFGWWWLTFGSDEAADTRGRPLTLVPDFVTLVLTNIFEALTPVGTLVGIAMLATTAVLAWRARDPRAHDVLVTMAVTMLVMVLGVAVERVGFGVEFAASSRYAYMGAVLIAPAFALGVDQLGRIGRPAMLAGLLALAAGAGMQAARLAARADDWADRAAVERHQLELFAAAPLPPGFDMDQACLGFSPDVRCHDVPALVADGAITPRPPATDADRAYLEGLLDGVAVP
jgi:hypothetical protein